ncbi:winged helix-turn-helix domain-containing protein [Marinicella sediminis]|uniref:Winged helix-turn-helix domain-containing protein n=1 Tax=Marinicella sediminis TaxID=1792834 RepID=A0ABV7JGC7_9GAMM|nr:winged helix-turn-helix domain-containing protein [Marinicella sediminis]
MKYPLFQHTLTIRNDRVYANGHGLNLSARGHAALIMMLQSNGRILNKEQLMKHLWQGLVVSDDSLFKVIQEIRSEIRKLGVKQQVLVNVYGKGYQWKVPQKQPRSRIPFMLVGLLLVILTMLWFFTQTDPAPQLTDQQFNTQLNAIQSGAEVVLPPVPAANSGHPVDQLMVRYLHAVQAHQSGHYEQSIQLLKQGLKLHQGQPIHPLLADTNYLLARMYIYRDDRDTLKHHLDEAQRLYAVLKDNEGLLDVAIERARYHQVLLAFDRSVELLHEVLTEARAQGSQSHELRAHSNLAYAHQQLSQPAQRMQSLQHSLELALQLADGKYAAYSYGELAEIHAQKGQYKQAMKQAELALRFVINQHDTNVFQQGFSAFYLLLRPLGHDDLAEKYLQRAIDTQQQFNDQVMLVTAELQLAKIYSAQQQHERSTAILNTLAAEQLTVEEQQELQALLAYNSYFTRDNISAFTRSKPMIDSGQSNRQAQLYARAAFVLSGWQLEREAEVRDVMEQFAAWVNQDDVDEMTVFLLVADQLADEFHLSDWELGLRHQKAEQLASRKAEIRQQTRPDDQLMIELDAYLDRIMVQ